MFLFDFRNTRDGFFVQPKDYACIILNDRGVLRLEVLAEGGVIREPPIRRARKENVVGASFSRRFQCFNRGCTVGRMMAGVITIFLAREVPRSTGIEF